MSRAPADVGDPQDWFVRPERPRGAAGGHRFHR